MSATRYFTDGTATWKFAHGKRPMMRYNDSAEWGKSAFYSLAEFKAAPGNTTEISEEEGEP